MLSLNSFQDIIPHIFKHLIHTKTPYSSFSNDENLDLWSLYSASRVCRSWFHLAAPLLWAKPKMGPRLSPIVWRRFLQTLIFSFDSPNSTLLPYHSFVTHLEDLWLFVGGEDDVPEQEQLVMRSVQNNQDVIKDLLQEILDMAIGEYGQESSSDADCDYSKKLTRWDSKHSIDKGILIPYFQSVLGFPCYSMTYAVAIIMQVSHIQSMRLHVGCHHYGTASITDLPWEKVLKNSLKSLDVRCKMNKGHLMSLLQTGAPLLQSLNLEWTEDFDDHVLTLISKSCPRLKHLMVKMTPVSTTRKHLTRTSRRWQPPSLPPAPTITDDGLLEWIQDYLTSSQQQVEGACAPIETLKLYKADKITQQAWQYCLNNLPHLEDWSVTLNAAGGVTPEWICQVLQDRTCSLKRLEVVGGSNENEPSCFYSQNSVMDEQVILRLPHLTGASKLKELILSDLDFCKSHGQGYATYYGSGGFHGSASDLIETFHKAHPHIRLIINEKNIK